MLTLIERTGSNDVNTPVHSEFSRKLYTDHLEEIEYLLAQRRVLLSDLEVPWPSIGDFERRLLAHVQGTVIGRDSADMIAEEWLEDGDPDQISGALFALANSREPSAIKIIYGALEKTYSESLCLFTDALRHPNNPRISELLTSLLNHEKSELRALAVDTLGYRREGDSVVIAARLKDDDTEVVGATLRAIRRMRCDLALSDVEKLIHQPDTALALEAALTLTTFSHPSGRDWLKSFCFSPQTDYNMAPIYLAQCGIATDSRIILQSDAAHSLSGIEALGILGDSFAVDHLLIKLQDDDEAVKYMAGKALNLITGANLTEKHVVCDAWEGPDGEIIEEEETAIERVSTDYDDWKRWWQSNARLLPNGEQLRFGSPITIEALVDEIALPTTPKENRQRAYYELLCRQHKYVPYEADWFVTKQNGAVARLRS